MHLERSWLDPTAAPDHLHNNKSLTYLEKQPNVIGSTYYWSQIFQSINQSFIWEHRQQ